MVVVMSLKKVISGLSAALLLGGLSSAQAATLTVDGSLADWGITVADGNGSNFTALTPGIGLFASPFIEDTNDSWGDGGYVGPNHGGQNYDVEFMGAALQGNRLFLAIVSGLRPDNGLTRFGPGDIYIQSAAGVFGIEMGGGIGGGAGGVITEGSTGSTYELYSNGYTSGHDDAAAVQQAGTIWKDVQWLMDPIAPATPVQFEVVDGVSTQVSTADYVYTRNTVTDQHSIMELSLDVRDLLGGTDGGTLEFHWGPTCGNDVATITLFIPESDEEQVSEPGFMFAFGLGLLGLAVYRRKTAI